MEIEQPLLRARRDPGVVFDPSADLDDLAYGHRCADRRAAVTAEELVARYAGTHSSDFPALRASGVVPLDVLAVGARTHPNPAIRWRCLTLLDHLGGDESTDTFVAALDDPVPRVRRHAVHALACNRCKERPLCADVAPVLDRVARTDPNPKVRAEAAAALARQLGRRPTSSLRT